MTIDVERYISVKNPFRARGSKTTEWRTVPNCARLRVWHMSMADALIDEMDEDANLKRFIFHINYVEGVQKGSRVSYLGEQFMVLGVSDSTRLRGLELRCVPQN